MSLLEALFDTSDFPARWHCGQWSDVHGWTHIISDIAIFSAYMAIPLALMVFVRRCPDLPKPFPIVFWLFIAFILACGLTHLNEAIIFWHPFYRFAGAIKLVTAIVSLTTVGFLIPALPAALSLRTPESLKKQVDEATELLRAERNAAGRFEAIVACSQDAIISMDLDGRVTSWNPAAEQISGYTADEMVGQTLARLVPEARRGELGERIQQLLEGKRLAPFETERLHRSGTTIFVSITMSTIVDATGEPSGFVAVTRDIGTRKKRERLKRAAEARYRDLYDNAPDMYVSANSEGVITECNRATRSTLGYPRDALVGMQVLDLYAESCRSAAESLWERFIQGEEVVDEELQLCTKNGEVLDVSLSIAGVGGPDEPKQARLAWRDISERRRTERIFRTMVEASPSSMLAVDKTGTIVLANKETERLFGYSQEELLGRPVELLVPTPIQHNHVSLRTAFLKAPQRRSMGKSRELAGRRKDGHLVPVEVGLNPVDTPQGPLVLSTIIDLTALVEKQAAIERQTRELKRSNSELERFAYVASHDLQEPLRMISSYAQLLKQRYHGKLDEDANTYIDFAVDGALRMQALIKDLLDYSRVHTRGREFGEADTQQLLEGVVADLRQLIKETDANVCFKDMPEVMADAAQLRQVFQNLIGNAINFRGTEQPRVDIAAHEEGDRWVFSVQDNGIGFEMAFADKIFMMFQRLQRDSDTRGTGIGLAICKSIVERHGGSIWAASQPGQGSTFTFTLPKSPGTGGSLEAKTC